MAPSQVLSIDSSRPLDQPYSGYRYVLRLALVFALYYGAGKVGLAVPFTSFNVSPVWPAAGVAVSAVLIWGIGIAPAIALAAFLVNFLSSIPAPMALGIGLGNASSAVLAGYLLKRFSDFQLSLPRLRDVLRFVMLAVVLATTVAAFVGVTSLTIGHIKAWSSYSSAWRIWWLGDAMGVLVVAPLLLTGQELLRVCRGWRALEAGLLLVAILATAAAIFGPWAGVRDDVLAFVVFPYVIWAAIRFRVAGAAGAGLLVATVAVWGTAHGFGPFVNHAPLHNAVLLQIFIAVTSLTGLILAAVISEKQQLGEALKERTRELEQNTVQLAYQAELLDLANDAILVRTAADEISYWNEGAERLYGWAREEVLGKSLHKVLRTEFPVSLPEILQSDRWEGELRHRRKDGSKIVVASRWTTLRDHNGKPVGSLEINTDVTARRRAEEAARSLSGRILTLQDDERRRIARGLHDSLGQYLAALAMKLDLLSTQGGKRAKSILECSQLVEQCLSETRTISHLLHPPLLDEAGIGSAVRLYVDGFAQRSGIQVHLDLPPELDRLQEDIEIALFRAVQEALTNVHRHSGSSSVYICINLDAEQVRLEIKDNGRGIPKKHLTLLTEGDAGSGVGIAGMRERVRELRGSLEIQSDKTGTRVLIVIPSMPRSSVDSAHDGGRSWSISA
jgi:PAS domain S-box-containing protein